MANAPGSGAPIPVETADTMPAEPFEGEGWQPMFDGKTLTGWRETEFAGRGEVQCDSGLLVLNMGDPFTGINWTNDFPKINFEVALDAMRVSGSDFFCGLTVPVRDSFCSLIVGGWGGSLLGISSLDHMDASENETVRISSPPDSSTRSGARGSKVDSSLDDNQPANSHANASSPGR